jgi:hypothetical protein
MAIKYSKWSKIYQHLPFKGPPKLSQIWDFWFENKPSGNPGTSWLEATRKLVKRESILFCFYSNAAENVQGDQMSA